MGKQSSAQFKNDITILALFKPEYSILSPVFEDLNSHDIKEEDLSRLQSLVAGFIEHKYDQQDKLYSELPTTFCDELHHYMMEEKGLDVYNTIKFIEMIGDVFMTAHFNSVIFNNLYLDYEYEIEDQEVNFLSISELDRIKWMEHLNDEESITRDLFVFSCYTGLTYQDLQTITIDCIEYEDLTIWLWVHFDIPHKTRCIPLFDASLRIIKKYEELREQLQTTKIFPLIFPENTEPHLAKIAEVIDIDFKLSFAEARFTYATTVANMKQIPSEIVSEIEGFEIVKETVEFQDLVLFEYLNQRVRDEKYTKLEK